MLCLALLTTVCVYACVFGAQHDPNAGIRRIAERYEGKTDAEIQEHYNKWNRDLKRRKKRNRSNVPLEATVVAQQSNLPSLKDPRLWLLKCKVCQASFARLAQWPSVC